MYFPLLAIALLFQTVLGLSDGLVPSHTKRDSTNISACGRLSVVIVVVVPGTIGVDVALNLGICVCLSLGLFTGDSQVRLRALVDSAITSGLLAGISADDAMAYISEHSPSDLISNNCAAPPAHSFPYTDHLNTCTECHHTCETNYYPCGETCYNPTTQTCQSGVPTNLRRRWVRGRDNIDLRCASGHTACEIPNISSNSVMNRLECIDTFASPESCGGCLYPRANQEEGEDCTAIPNVADVGCHQGTCVIRACARGYILSDGECISKKSDLGEILGLGGKLLKQGLKNELVYGSSLKRRAQPQMANQNRKRDVL